MIGIVLAGERKKRNHRRMAIVLGVIALAMILAFMGCGGSSTSPGGGGGGGNGGTPVGGYQITVTGTGTAGTNHGNSAPHTLNVTLNVT